MKVRLISCSSGSFCSKVKYCEGRYSALWQGEKYCYFCPILVHLSLIITIAVLLLLTNCSSELCITFFSWYIFSSGAGKTKFRVFCHFFSWCKLTVYMYWDAAAAGIFEVQSCVSIQVVLLCLAISSYSVVIYQKNSGHCYFVKYVRCLSCRITLADKNDIWYTHGHDFVQVNWTKLRLNNHIIICTCWVLMHTYIYIVLGLFQRLMYQFDMVTDNAINDWNWKSFFFAVSYRKEYLELFLAIGTNMNIQ